MANRKNRPGAGGRPESEAKPGDDPRAAAGDAARPAEATPSDAPASAVGGRTPPEEEALPEEKTLPEDMAPLDAASVGPDPDPGAAAGPRDRSRPSDAEAAGESDRDRRDAVGEPAATAPEAVPPAAATAPLAASPMAIPPAAGTEAGREAEAPAGDEPAARADADAAAGIAGGPRPAGTDAARPDEPVAAAGAGGTDVRDPAGHRDGAGSGEAAADEADREEAGGRSVAGTLLAALLLLIAGAAIGIWAAPRLAPHLPSGMAPVAAWLTPGAAQMEARVAATESEMRAEVAALRDELARIEAEMAEPPVPDPALAELEQRLAGQMEALQGDLGALDGGETRDRLSRLEAAVEGQQETLASLRDQLAGIDVEGEAAAQIDAYQAELQGLRGEIRDVAGQVGTLSRRIDEVAAQAQQQVELARAQVEEIETQAQAGLTRAEIEADLAEIRSALASGTPYDAAAGRLAMQPDVAVPAGLYEAAPEGVPTLAALRQGFPDAASRAIRADVQADTDDTAIGRLRGLIEAQVATRSLEPREGTDTDAILSRMEDAVRRDDLDTALAEAEALPPQAAEAMSGWLAAARTRQAAVSGFDRLQADLTAMN